MTRPDPPQLEDAETAAAARRVFDDAGYTAEQIQARLGTEARSLAQTPDRPVYLRRVGEQDALAVLLRMLLLDVPVARAVATERLGSTFSPSIGPASAVTNKGVVNHSAITLASGMAGKAR